MAVSGEDKWHLKLPGSFSGSAVMCASLILKVFQWRMTAIMDILKYKSSENSVSGVMDISGFLLSSMGIWLVIHFFLPSVYVWYHKYSFLFSFFVARLRCSRTRLIGFHWALEVFVRLKAGRLPLLRCVVDRNRLMRLTPCASSVAGCVCLLSRTSPQFRRRTPIFRMKVNQGISGSCLVATGIVWWIVQ